MNSGKNDEKWVLTREGKDLMSIRLITAKNVDVYHISEKIS